MTLIHWGPVTKTEFTLDKIAEIRRELMTVMSYGAHEGAGLSSLKCRKVNKQRSPSFLLRYSSVRTAHHPKTVTFQIFSNLADSVFTQP